MRTEFSCRTTDRKALLEALRKLAPFGNTPIEMSGSPTIGDVVENPEHWIDPSLCAKRRVSVSWDESFRSFINIRNEYDQITEVVAGEHRLGLDYFLPMMRSQPIEVLCMVWDYFDDARRLMGHSRLGWGCLFKGQGHGYFASPRWLEHGPWLLERHQPDITYVQLYDLAAEGEAAWQQGRRAMARLSDGFFTEYGASQFEQRGAYSPADRSFSVIKTDQGIGPFELWRLCLLRAKNRRHATEPIERLRVTFTEERDARRHLHELWLREIECWALGADGRRVRLDLDYQPPPRLLPEWLERHQGLPVSGPYAAAVPWTEPPPPEPKQEQEQGPESGRSLHRVRLSLGLSSLTGPLQAEERRSLLALLTAHRREGLRDVPAGADSADAARAIAELVDVGAPSPLDPPLEQTHAALASTPFVVDVFLPPERIGLSLPALLVSDEFPSQAPIRRGDLGAAATGAAFARLIGAMVLPVDDVLARVSALGRQDLQCAEDLLALCAKYRLIVVATKRPIPPP